MKKEDIIDTILNNLINSGSEISYIKELRDKSNDIINEDIPLDEVLSNIGKDIEVLTRMFLNKKNEYDINFISGISSGIYLLDDNSYYKYNIIGGNKTRYTDDKINQDTLFDVASITKLYTLILLFKLEELGLIDLNIQVKDINPNIQNLEDYTLNDLVLLCGEYNTKGKIAECSSYEEAYLILKTVYLTSNDRTKGIYNDYGALVIGDTIEKVISNKLGKNMKLDEIMYEYLFKPLNINNTMFTPKIINLSGNNYADGLPHDPKSRALGGVCGHAGLFTNSEELFKLSDGLMNKGYINSEHLKRLGEVTFNGSSKGNLGVYVKHPKGYEYTYVPPEYSTGSFAHQGWTGGIAVFDPVNKIHNNILVNSVVDFNDSRVFHNKPVGYRDEFSLYQSEITKKIMLMYVAKKIYNKYFGYKDSINNIVLIR